MRALAVMTLQITLAIASLSSCLLDRAGERATQDVDEGDVPGCVIDEDCVGAASSCCGCPTFARPAGESVCDPLDCAPASCAPTEAICDRGSCRLACLPVEATVSCDAGFEVDEAGCTVDRCAAETAIGECEVDGDCVQVPADCCGCARGGRDTAIAGDDSDGYLAGLECGGDAQCPGVDTCDADSAPRCVGGICRLVSASDTDVPTSVCGSPDTGACAADERCVLNDPEAPAGAGICRPR